MDIYECEWNSQEDSEALVDSFIREFHLDESSEDPMADRFDLDLETFAENEWNVTLNGTAYKLSLIDEHSYREKDHTGRYATVYSLDPIDQNGKRRTLAVFTNPAWGETYDDLIPESLSEVVEIS